MNPERTHTVDTYNNIKRQWSSIGNRLRRRGNNEAVEAYEEMVSYASRMKATYPDYLSFRAYHALVGSTIPAEFEPQVTKEDFPGEDSVETFLQNLKQKFNI